jgi:copper chaperone CopZ
MSTESTTTTYAISGMTCGHCELSVREEVEAVAGVTSAVADRQSGTLTITGDADPGAVAAAVAEAGYEVVA